MDRSGSKPAAAHGRASQRPNVPTFRAILLVQRPPDVSGPCVFSLANRTKMLHVKHFGTICKTEWSENLGVENRGRAAYNATALNPELRRTTSITLRMTLGKASLSRSQSGTKRWPAGARRLFATSAT
jgi:hypothetical protein